MVKKVMKYKKSIFNYIQQNADYYLIYNTLYNSLIRLDTNEYDKYNKVENTTDDICSLFVENGLWVECDIDEKAKYLACAEAYTLYVPRPLSITITTTLKCNARCQYCYEKGVNQVDICEGSEEKIVEFIKRHNSSEDVHLIWFGGEPLLNMSFMDLLCSRLTEEGIKYSSYIISNGSLLNNEIIGEKFQYWNIKDMQITLDGTKEIYKTIKNYKNPNEGEFYTILNNIRQAVEKGVFVNIRLNIGRNNQDSILDLLKELDTVFFQYDTVVFYPAFITGEKELLSEEERVEFVKKMLLSMKNIKKLTTSTKFYSLPRMHACMNGDPMSFSIDVNGNIYSCEHYVGKSEFCIGNLTDDLKKQDLRGRNTKFQDNCDSCVFLPKCFGGCEANRVEGDVPCMIEKYLIKAYLQLL